MKLVLLCLFLSAFSQIVVSQQYQYIPFPKNPDGLTVLGNGDSNFVIDAFVDLMCPDCAEAYPKLMGAIEELKLDQNTDFKLKFHIFPLPFHHNAFLSTVVEKYIQDNYSVETAHNFIKLMFDQQQSFWDIHTLNVTEQEIMNNFASLVAKNFTGLITYDEIVTALIYGNSNYMDAANGWRLGCIRGVADTPTFFVNGIKLDAASGGSANFSQADWVSFLSQYFPQQKMITIDELIQRNLI